MDAAVRRDVPPCGITSSGCDWEVKSGCWDWGGWELEEGVGCRGGGGGPWSSGSWLWRTCEKICQIRSTESNDDGLEEVKQNQCMGDRLRCQELSTVFPLCGP